MMIICFALCAALSFSAVFLHEIYGSPMTLRPLNATDLEKQTKGILNFSWHADTISIISMGVLFTCSVLIPGNALMALVATGMSFGLSCLAFGMAIFYDSIMWKTPAPYVWTIIALIGIAGLLS